MSLKSCKFEQFLYINFKANKRLYSALYALHRDYEFDLFTEDSQRFRVWYRVVVRQGLAQEAGMTNLCFFLCNKKTIS